MARRQAVLSSVSVNQGSLPLSFRSSSGPWNLPGRWACSEHPWLSGRLHAAAPGSPAAAPDHTSTPLLSSPAEWLAPALSVLAALVVRLPFVLAADFPLGDGGLFAQIIDDLRAAGFTLPVFTTFNGGSIPLCYPPLALLLAALSGLPTLGVLLWAPLALSSLVPGAISVLGTQILRSEHAGLATGLVAALLPIPYWFGLEGGGLTRSLGLLLMALSVLALLRMLESPSIRLALSAGVLLGASALTHPEGGLVTAGVAIAAAACSGRLIATRRACALATLAAVATLLPWLVVVVSRHGFAPFLNALRAGDGFGSLELAGGRLLSWQLAGEPHLTLFAALALLGLPVAIARGWGLPLVWTLLPILLVPRNCRYWAAPGLALLCGGAIVAVCSALRHLARSPGHAAGAQVVLASCILAHGIVLSHAWDGRLTLLQPLRQDDREACAWLSAHVRPGEATAVTGVGPDGLDTLAEWAPYLAGVENVLVGQGREWLGDMQGVEQHAGRLHDALRTGGDAVSRWLATTPRVRWLVVGSGPSANPRVLSSLREGANAGVIRLAHVEGSATIWRVEASRSAVSPPG